MFKLQLQNGSEASAARLDKPQAKQAAGILAKYGLQTLHNEGRIYIVFLTAGGETVTFVYVLNGIMRPREYLEDLFLNKPLSYSLRTARCIIHRNSVYANRDFFTTILTVDSQSTFGALCSAVENNLRPSISVLLSANETLKQIENPTNSCGGAKA